MPGITRLHLKQAEKIQKQAQWECGEHDEFSQEHIEKCLNKMLAAYVNGDRNYAVDCAKIECTEMCTLTHCIAYEKGKTRLYDVVKEGPGIERNYIPDGREEGERYFLGDREELLKMQTLHALHAKEASANGIRMATVLDRICLRDVKEGVERIDKPTDGLETTEDANIVSMGNCRIMREADMAEIEKRLDESIKYGTCYSLIKPLGKWVNPLCTESMTGNCIQEDVGDEDVIRPSCTITRHHKVMKFDTEYGEQEGLTMLSTLLCARGGIITIKVHGQICLNHSIEDDLEDRIQELMDSIEGKPVSSFGEICGLPTVEILARMIFQESHTYKSGEQNAIVYSVVNRLFWEISFADTGEDQTLKNILTADNQYRSLLTYSPAYHPPQTESDDEYDSWENAKRLAAIMMVTLEDNVPDYNFDKDIGEIVIVDTGASKEDICEMIGSQTDICGERIDNLIGNRPNFHAVDSEYEAKEGEVIIYTNGKRQDGGHVFH